MPDFDLTAQEGRLFLCLFHKTTKNRKINLQIAVRNEIRKKLLKISGIDSTRIQLPNTTFKKPDKSVWIRESVNERSEEPISNAAGCEFMVVNYEIFCKASLGADRVDNVAEALRIALPVSGTGSTIYQKNGQYAFIKSIDKPAGGIDSAEPTWYRSLVAVTIKLYNL